MPLTPLQQEVLQCLAGQRTPRSHVAGGAVINRSSTSPRFSADLDLFHDGPELIAPVAEADAAVLRGQGFGVEWLLEQPYIRRARITKGTDELGLDWVQDSPFRFFPVQPDAEFGYCLHRADLATNKALALGGRSEVRDFLDILFLHETYLSLGALCWAACGKDQGFTPWSLLEFAQRHVRFRQEDLSSERLHKPLQLTELKKAWMKAAREAEQWLSRLPAAEVGCLYLDASLNPVTPDPAGPGFADLARHFGSVGGSWPTRTARS